MNKSILFLCVVLCCPLLFFAQSNPTLKSPPTEIGLTDAEWIDRLMAPVPGIGSTARDMLEAQSVKPYLMPVRRVGVRGDERCYILASCLEYYVNLDQNYKFNLSPDFIALNLQSGQQTDGIRAAFTFLVENGTVSAAILPFDAKTLTSAVYATPKYRITNYLHLFREFTKDRQKVYEVRKALMRGHPVVVELAAAPEVRNMLNTRTWKAGKGDSGLVTLLVVGYDEGEEAFELMSCWGRSWGDGGYIWISYDDFSRQAANAYVMAPLPEYAPR